MLDYFGELNNVELSMLYYLETEIASEYGTTVSLVNSFEQVTQTALPVICVELPSEEDSRLEIGDNNLISEFLIVVNIFATSNTERKALAYFIKDKIKEGSVYYTHAQSGGVLNRTAAGRLTMRSIITNAKLEFGESAESHDQFRHNISFIVRRNYI